MSPAHAADAAPGLTRGHERLVVATGERSRATIVIAVHSTALGPALGGCRLWRYPRLEDAVRDALRLSEAMTAKNALAGLSRGGGKAVVLAPPDLDGDADLRERIFLDLGDLVASLEGRYVTAEDVGTHATDMTVVARRTDHVVGLPASLGGRGDPGEYTARGVLACLDAVASRRGLDAPLRVAIAGLGQVGGRLARDLAGRGATLMLSDVAPARRRLADELGATWVEPDRIHRCEADVFMPAGVGGMLTRRVIAELGAPIVLGPANNQLADDDGADLLAARGILYAPDYVVNAGGVLYLGHEGETVDAIALVDRLGTRLEMILDAAERDGVTPHAAADRLVAQLVRGRE